LNVSIERGRLAALIESTMGTIRLGSPLVVLALGAVLVLRGEMSLGTMLTLNALAVGFLLPLATLVGTAEQFQLMGSYIGRLDDVFGTAPEQDDAKVVAAVALTGAINLENVSFRYGELAPLVVRDVSVDIEPGQFVALVGPSGSGKSTLASLLLALYRPTSGRILYDGRDLAGLDTRSVRTQFGVVMQRPYIFGASVRDNVTLTDPGLPLDAVIEAAKLAQIHDELTAMPMGYETLLSDAGASISGGQRQRIALARALVRNPSIVLLDEATSALDAVTEARVQEAIETLRCTRIVIAHRLSTIVKADLILMMKDGAIVERGTHQELFARRGPYYDLVVAQMAQGVVGSGIEAIPAEVVRRAG
jgi:ABC-type bacteriocin/lantibiotic exporter with double-glycine peptidase domain